MPHAAEGVFVPDVVDVVDEDDVEPDEAGLSEEPEDDAVAAAGSLAGLDVGPVFSRPFSERLSLR
jgi:hypothetical protein